MRVKSITRSEFEALVRWEEDGGRIIDDCYLVLSDDDALVASGSVDGFKGPGRNNSVTNSAEIEEGDVDEYVVVRDSVAETALDLTSAAESLLHTESHARQLGTDANESEEHL